MRLNYDCVRDLLLYFEENLSYEDRLPASNIQLKQYDADEILYTIKLLYESGYIDAIPVKSLSAPTSFIVQSLTMKGHELLDNVRDNKVWKKTKERASKLASVSINILSNLASGIALAMLTQQM